MELIQSIQNRIYRIRGERVMLDKDLSTLYEVETKVFNQAVKRNARRFPPDFMFHLTKEEAEAIRAQTALNQQVPSRSQIVTLNTTRGQNIKYLPFAFTEQGVAMLSGILNSDKAIDMNIAIMRAFVAIKQLTLKEMDLRQQLKQIKERLGEHGVQLKHIYEALENLLDEDAAQRKWENRDRIGFKK